MKSVELPDHLVLQAEEAASRRGMSLARFLEEAVQAKAAFPLERSAKTWPVTPPRITKAESQRIDALISAEFGRVEPESWR